MMTVIMVPGGLLRGVSQRRTSARPGDDLNNVPFRIQESLFHRCRLPDHRGGRSYQPRANAGGHVPVHEHSGGGRGDVLLGHAAGADRNRHHQPFRALLYAGRRHRAYRIAVAARRQRDQGLFPAGHQSRFGGDHNLESGDGAVAPAAARHAAAGGPEVRRLQPAGVPGDVQGRRIERDATCATWPSSRCATRSPAFPAPACRSRSAGSTARSWCTPIRTSWRPTS